MADSLPLGTYLPPYLLTLVLVLEKPTMSDLEETLGSLFHSKCLCHTVQGS